MKSTVPENDEGPVDEILPPKPTAPDVLSRITLPFVSYSLPSKALPITVPDVCIVPVEVILLNVTLSVVASDWSETTA